MRKTWILAAVFLVAWLFTLASLAFGQTAGQIALRDEAHRDEGENRMRRDASWAQSDYAEEKKQDALNAKVKCTDPEALGLGNLAFADAEDWFTTGEDDEFDARQLRVITGLIELSAGDTEWQIALDLQAIGDPRADDHFADAADHYQIASVAFDTSDVLYSNAADDFFSAAHWFGAAETHYILGSGGGQGGGSGGGLFCVQDEIHTVPLPPIANRPMRVEKLAGMLRRSIARAEPLTHRQKRMWRNVGRQFWRQGNLSGRVVL